MKNLKVSKKFKAIVLAGTMIVLGAYVSESGKSDIEKYYDFNINGIYTYAKMFDGFNDNIFDYKKFLIDNNLVPLLSSDSFIEKCQLSDGSYLEKKVYNSETDSYDWKIINKKELKDFSGVVHKSDDFIKNIYEVTNENGNYKINKVSDFLNMNLSKEYFVPMDDPIDLIGPSETIYYNGEDTIKIKK